jgi:tetraacyldisaccharide 4'-kinase
MHTRERFIANNILPTRHLPAPVISVGNLTVGGTGKTPLTLFLAQKLLASNLKVSILSRGYGRRAGSPQQVVSDGRRILCRVEEAGDEPFMMAKQLPDVGIWVGADRYRVGMTSWEQEPVDVFLLDDGFQHRRLYRELDIVVLRAPKSLGNRKLFPAGPLRELPTALERANLVILNESSEPLGTLGGKGVALVCGIGNPDGFKSMISSLGAQVRHCLAFPDHHWYTPRDVSRMRELLGDVDLMVTTEKDAWKLLSAGMEGEDIWALRIGMEVQDEEVLEERLSRLTNG